MTLSPGALHMAYISLTDSQKKSLAGCDVSLHGHRSGLSRLALRCAGTQVVLHKGFSCTLDWYTCSQAPSLANCRPMHLHGAHLTCSKASLSNLRILFSQSSLG